jgi:hypothetical protein
MGIIFIGGREYLGHRMLRTEIREVAVTAIAGPEE